jgi:putative endonuclease
VIGLLYRAFDALRRRTFRDNHGRMGEDLAHRYLRRRGYTVVARNYRPRSGPGEIDLVAWHGDRLVFVEVKTRASVEFGTPDRAVDEDKRVALERAAREYARRANVGWEKTRFDIVSVVLARPVRVDWMQDAFGHGRRTPGSTAPHLRP